MASPARADGVRIAAPRTLLLGVTTGLAWVALIVAAPAGLSWICGPSGLVLSAPAWDATRLLWLGTMWGVMSVAMMLPCVAVGGPSNGSIRPIASAALGGALAHWVLESLGLLTPTAAVVGVPLLIALLTGAGLCEIAKWRWPRSAALTIQMICLSLAGGAMDPSWMAVVTLWMVADTMLQQSRRLADRAFPMSGS
jgi:hypothetical protein